MLVVAFAAMPILMMSMFGFMFPQTGSSNPYSGKISSPYENVPMALIVDDTGHLGREISAQFTQMAYSTKLFKVQDFKSYTLARDQLVAGTLKAIVVIPAGLTSSLASRRQATVQVTVDDTNPQMASIIYSLASSILKTISGRMAASIVAGMDSSFDPTFVLDPMSVERKTLVGGTSNSFQFLAPGFMALTVVMGALSGLGAAIAREKEQGTIDGIMVAPISRDAIVVGKVLAQTVRGMTQGFLILGISMLFFEVRVHGSPFLMVLVMLLGVSSFAGIGIIMTSVAQDQETAMMMIMLLQFPMMFLSGVVLPIEQLPTWLQLVGKSLPLYYASDALRKIIVLNAEVGQILPDIMMLIVYSVVTLAIAIPVFKRAMTR